MSSDFLANYIRTLLPARRRTSPKGWISFNAVCCHHNGERPDTRGRGGIIFGPGGKVNYHCFNCGFVTRYWPGDNLSIKMRKLLKWFGADDLEINRLKLEALRVKSEVSTDLGHNQPTNDIVLQKYDLPPETKFFSEIRTYLALMPDSDLPKELESFKGIVEYAYNRKINLDKYDLAWSTSKDHLMNYRLIIPCRYKNEIYGYIARGVNNKIKPKYYAQHDGNFVFNLDMQNNKRKFVVVTEGAFDAMSIDAVAVMHNEINETQCELIESLGKDIVVVPDFDVAGSNLIDAALEYGWSVSFPVWRGECKDVNDAVVKYGKLFVLKSIIEGREDNPLKIKLKSKGLE
ncbi:MAG: hypothetical protein N2235_01570 [Fischerella sp.]|nr:hypothetical protein [Fischerella sp.]